MNIVKYVHNTPWQQILADISLYIDMHRNCYRLKNKCQKAKNKLIHIFFAGRGEKKYPACLEYKINVIEDMVVDIEDSYYHKPNMYVSYEKCPYFIEEKSGKPCACIDCPCYTKNQEFFVAQSNYNMQVKKRDEFWQHCMARTK